MDILQGIFGCGAHSDYGVLTILATDANKALQIEAAGEWVDVEPKPGCFIINLGDILQRCDLQRSADPETDEDSMQERLNHCNYCSGGGAICSICSRIKHGSKFSWLLRQALRPPPPPPSPERNFESPQGSLHCFVSLCSTCFVICNGASSASKNPLQSVQIQVLSREV